MAAQRRAPQPDPVAEENPPSPKPRFWSGWSVLQRLGALAAIVTSVTIIIGAIATPIYYGSELIHRVGSIDEDVTKLQTNAQDIRDNLDAVQTEVHSVHTELSVVQTEVQDIRDNLDAVQTEVHSVHTELSVVQTEVQDIRSDLGDIRDDVVGVGEEVAELAKGVSYIRGRFDEADDNKSLSSQGHQKTALTP